jgi:hypothetical protein
VTQDNFLPPYGYQSGEIEDDDEVGRSLHRDDDAAGHVKVSWFANFTPTQSSSM